MSVDTECLIIFTKFRFVRLAANLAPFSQAIRGPKTETDVMVTCSPAFSRASHCLHLFASRYDWFID